MVLKSQRIFRRPIVAKTLWPSSVVVANKTGILTDEKEIIEYSVGSFVVQLGTTLAKGPKRDNHDEIVLALKRFSFYLNTKSDIRFVWSDVMRECVHALKLAFIFENYHFRHIFSKDLTTKDFNNIDGTFLTEVASHVMLLFCLRFFEKDSYSFLSTLVQETKPGWALFDLFHIQGYDDSKPFRYKLSKCIDYDPLLKLLKVAVNRAAGTLVLAEGKTIHRQNYRSYQNYYRSGRRGAFTPFSMEIARLLEDLIFLTRGLITHFLSIKAEFLNWFCMLDLLIAITDHTPFNKIAPHVWVGMIDFLLLHETRSPRIPRKFMLPMLISCMENDSGRSTHFKRFFQNVPYSIIDNSVASKIVKRCLHGVTFWFGGLLTRQDSFQERHHEVKLEFKLLCVLADKHFKYFQQDSLLCFRLMIDCLEGLTEFEDYVRREIFCVPDIRNVRKDQLGDILFPFKMILNIIENMTRSVAAISDEFVLQDKPGCDFGYVNSFSRCWDRLNDILPTLIVSHCSAIGCGIVDCCSALTENIFDMFNDEIRSSILENFYSYAYDTRSDVRTKAGRLLGHLVQHKSLAEDFEFMVNVLEAIEMNIRTGDSFMKMTYSWTLGNLSEAFIHHYKEGVPQDVNFVINVFQLAIKCATFDLSRKAKKELGHMFKVRYNGFRTIGKLLSWVPDDAFFHETLAKTIITSADAIRGELDSGIDFKSRWNAAGAAFELFRNRSIVRMAKDIVSPLTKSLCTVGIEGRNFKERFHSLSALRQLTTRTDFGVNYVRVWETAILCADISSQEARSTEHVQIDKLKFEAYLLMVHMVGMTEPIDLRLIHELLVNNEQTIRKASIKATTEVSEANIPGRTQAKESLAKLKDRATFDDIETAALVILTKYFDNYSRVSVGPMELFDIC